MAFKASKERKRRSPDPVGKGNPLIPSAAIRMWYAQQLNAVVKPMMADYKAELNKAIEARPVKQFFAQDAAATDLLSRVMGILQSKWENIFAGFAKSLADDFVKKSDEHATSATKFSLSSAGIVEPRATYNEAVANVLGAAQKFNHTLITGIQQDVHEKIYTAVMLSLTSPDPQSQGASGIEAALRKTNEFSEDRIKLITRDQTSKLFSSLSDERMKENGCEEFEWLHSSAGKVPRPDHVHKNGQIFKLNDPRLWEGPKADQGPPGWAINCRCRKVPIINP